MAMISDKFLILPFNPIEKIKYLDECTGKDDPAWFINLEMKFPKRTNNA